MPEILWTPVAESDLDDILLHIALRDVAPTKGTGCCAYYDDMTRLRWTKNAIGHVSYIAHHPDTGGDRKA